MWVKVKDDSCPAHVRALHRVLPFVAVQESGTERAALLLRGGCHLPGGTSAVCRGEFPGEGREGRLQLYVEVLPQGRGGRGDSAVCRGEFPGPVCYYPALAGNAGGRGGGAAGEGHFFFLILVPRTCRHPVVGRGSRVAVETSEYLLQ